MARINRLDEHLSNMIAAGEVVERPMGIVKELVENSIDAGASHVELQIVQGGIDTITIIDDGYGMDAQDATLAFERHATSKLKEVNDLWNIHTMGFRGEALPSIASVSHVVLRTNDGSDATEVEINYGTLVSAKPCGTPKGTMIEVKNLFQKTPARFKHLKSPQYEFSLISDVVQKFALSHPEIGFCLSHDGRTVFKTRGNGNLQEVLMQIYGRETAKSAIALDGSDLDYHVCGYLIQPQFHRATKYYMLLYINGRMIRNYHLQKAVMDAYAPYMPKDRYPIAVVNMEMDAQLVDVNVHPSKWEIRLSKEKQLEKLVYETITNALKEHMEVPKVSVVRDKKTKVELQELEFTYDREDKVKQLHDEVNDSFAHPENLTNVDMTKLKAETQTVHVKEPLRYPQPLHKEPILEAQEHETVYKTKDKAEPFFNEKILSSSPIKKVDAQDDTPQEVTPQDFEKSEEPRYSKTEASTVQQAFHAQSECVDMKVSVNEEQEELHPTTTPRNPSLPQLRVIGQFHNCYIIAEGEKGLYIIDQHAAQERYHYEVIREQILAGRNEAQPLLLPLTMEASLSAVTQLDDLNAVMEQLGFHLEAFGEQTLVCREVPMWMKDVEEAAFLQDMIDIWEKDKELSLENLRKHAIATTACHSSIRFNRSLTMDEMKRVLDDLGKCEQPFHCPHGRPTLICMEERDLIHDFERG